MNWLPISTKTRTEPEFIGSAPAKRATWICLMLYCAEHENGGRISDCREWGNRRWMQTVGCTKSEANSETPLFHFDGKDLIVWGYDKDYEAGIAAKRIGGKRGGIASGKTRRNETGKDAANNASTNATNDSMRVSLQDTSNGEDWSGGERIGITAVRDARGEVPIQKTVDGLKADIPSLIQVREHAVVVGMSEADADEFFAFWAAAGWKDRNGVPVRNWRAKLASRKTTIAEKNAKEKTNGHQVARRRVADNHFQGSDRRNAGAF